MQNIEAILSVVTAVAGLLITTVTFILKFINSEKAKNTAEHINAVCGTVLSFIAEAEKIPESTGEQKKNYVLEQAKLYAEKNHLNFNQELIDSRIEQYIKLTKLVNYKNIKN